MAERTTVSAPTRTVERLNLDHAGGFLSGQTQMFREREERPPPPTGHSRNLGGTQFEILPELHAPTCLPNLPSPTVEKPPNGQSCSGLINRIKKL